MNIEVFSWTGLLVAVVLAAAGYIVATLRGKFNNGGTNSGN